MILQHTFSPTVDERLQTFRVLLIHHVDERRIDPSPCLDGIEATDDDVELEIIVLVLVLDLAVISGRGHRGRSRAENDALTG